MSKREYIDFKLFLTRPPDDQDACQVSLLPTPEVGETSTPVTVPAEEGPPADLLPQLAQKSITLRQLATLGKGLAKWLLPEGTIRERFKYAYDRAGPDGGVRLRLIIADHGLKGWPWEYVYLNFLDGPDSMEGFLALNERVSLVRHEPLPHPHPALSQAPGDLDQLRMVVAAASPDVKDLRLQPLDVEREVGLVQEAVAGFDIEGVHITAEPVLANATQAQLTDALRQKAYIFHFAGHGVPKYERDDLARDPAKEAIYLLLAAEAGNDKANFLSAADLARMLRAAGTRLALLGACHSGRRNERYPWDGIAGALAAAEIPAIISMQYEVIDTQAIAFSRAFYAALGLGLSLDEAVWSGRVAMLQTTANEDAINVEWGVPVLYSRLNDGAVFPERMAQATASADTFRKVFSQTVTGIQAGEMTGVKVELIKNGVKIVQKVKTVTGQVTGIKAGTAGAGANIVVEQEIETVGEGAEIIGGVFDEL